MFGSILKRYREKLGLKQVDLIDRISHIGAEFGGLDEVTYSRWENSRTKPSLVKMGKILKAFGLLDELSVLVDQVGGYKIKHYVERRYGTSFDGRDCAYHTIHDRITVSQKRTINQQELILYSSFNSKILGKDNLNEFTTLFSLSEESYLYQFYASDQSLLGHTIFHILDAEQFMKLSDITLEGMHLYERGKKILFISSQYAGNTEIFFRIVDELNKLLRSKNIAFFYTRVFHQELVYMFRALKFSILQKGPITKRGVHYKNNCYQWLGVFGETMYLILSDLGN
ncbi:helix-turn-helix transcriptional regulator [Shewanella algae]|uniref:helix-turn-helix transcriptional regulator n=1 Tax=Shewanella algae TaxID=38313 RepID=UPI001AADE937|nr:helix-turn-helix transcriptional regulator [Shewanella algae]MBO2656083.1 helix-turn-helix transcriptional regulator [Shewanella algae]